MARSPVCAKPGSWFNPDDACSAVHNLPLDVLHPIRVIMQLQIAGGSFVAGSEDGGPFGGLSSTLGGMLGRMQSSVKATNSIMSPLQWWLATVCAALTVLLVLGPAELRAIFAVALLCAIALFPLVFVAAFIRHPDRLQSEEHRQTMAYLHHHYRDASGATVIEGTATNIIPEPNQAEQDQAAASLARTSPPGGH